MKYRTRYVRALVDKPKEGADTLLLRWQRGRLHQEKFSIKITKEVGEYRVKQAAVRT